ncbi:hypothetical protein C2845_PM07G07740 [Panicum miliaceum]|uniref:Uncharacterized protein n=1 Tax=Panicum miliaceum TaxID=4540 RepID=A0A3L6SMI5_PANMI|nr:hypothetical protein C2845_PM07G07740 [Panicum miliaceum]
MEEKPAVGAARGSPPRWRLWCLRPPQEHMVPLQPVARAVSADGDEEQAVGLAGALPAWAIPFSNADLSLSLPNRRPRRRSRARVPPPPRTWSRAPSAASGRAPSADTEMLRCLGRAGELPSHPDLDLRRIEVELRRHRDRVGAGVAGTRPRCHGRAVAWTPLWVVIYRWGLASIEGSGRSYWCRGSSMRGRRGEFRRRTARHRGHSSPALGLPPRVGSAKGKGERSGKGVLVVPGRLGGWGGGGGRGSRRWSPARPGAPTAPVPRPSRVLWRTREKKRLDPPGKRGNNKEGR